VYKQLPTETHHTDQLLTTADTAAYHIHRQQLYIAHPCTWQSAGPNYSSVRQLDSRCEIMNNWRLVSRRPITRVVVTVHFQLIQLLHTAAHCNLHDNEGCHGISWASDSNNSTHTYTTSPKTTHL